jgi:hypothetical protein
MAEGWMRDQVGGSEALAALLAGLRRRARSGPILWRRTTRRSAPNSCPAGALPQFALRSRVEGREEAP